MKRERREECLVQFNDERVRIRIMFTRTGADDDDQGKRTVVDGEGESGSDARGNQSRGYARVTEPCNRGLAHVRRLIRTVRYFKVLDTIESLLLSSIAR